MLKIVSKVTLLALCVLSGSALASAQNVVHALTGTVTGIDATAKTVVVFTDTRAQSTFADKTAPNSGVQIDKLIRPLFTAVDPTTPKKPYCIVFYIEGAGGRSAVGLRDLGKGPFEVSKGLISKVDGKDTITVTDETDGPKTYKIVANTVSETAMGVVLGLKYQPHKGDKVRVVASGESADAALYIQVISAN